MTNNKNLIIIGIVILGVLVILNGGGITLFSVDTWCDEYIYVCDADGKNIRLYACGQSEGDIVKCDKQCLIANEILAIPTNRLNLNDVVTLMCLDGEGYIQGDSTIDCLDKTKFTCKGKDLIDACGQVFETCRSDETCGKEPGVNINHCYVTIPICSSPSAHLNQYKCNLGHVWKCIGGVWDKTGICGAGILKDFDPSCKSNNIVADSIYSLCNEKPPLPKKCSNPSADEGLFKCSESKIYQCSQGDWTIYKSCSDYGINWGCAFKTDYTTTSIGSLCKKGVTPSTTTTTLTLTECLSDDDCQSGEECDRGYCVRLCEFYEEKDDFGKCVISIWVWIVGALVAFMFIGVSMKTMKN